MSETIRVKVVAGEHANLDSLPLRYGIHFSNDTYIDLKNCHFLRTEYGKTERHHYLAEFINPNDSTNRVFKGHFVLMDKYGEQVLVTVWRDDDDKTEFYLSELLKKLRSNGKLTPSILLNMHPLYVRGEMNTSADVVDYLSRNLAESEINKIKESERAAREEADKYLEENENLKSANKELQKKSDLNREVALQAIDQVETLEKNNQLLEEKYTKLQQSIPEIIQAALDKVDRENSQKSKDNYLNEPAKPVTKIWNSKTGSTYKNIGIEASISDVRRVGTKIQLTYIDKNSTSQTITDFGVINGFVSDVYEYLNSRKEARKRAVLILTFKPDKVMKLASDTMKLPEYSGLWRN